jgi:hypothetical protein
MIFQSFSLVTPLLVARQNNMSLQREWRDKVFHVGNVVQCGTSCRANACGTTMLFGHASPIGATKRVRSENFLERLFLKH